MSRYGKRPSLIVYEEEPFNAETGLAALAESAVTATDAFYVRAHGAVPDLDPAAGVVAQVTASSVGSAPTCAVAVRAARLGW